MVWTQTNWKIALLITSLGFCLSSHQTSFILSSNLFQSFDGNGIAGQYSSLHLSSTSVSFLIESKQAGNSTSQLSAFKSSLSISRKMTVGNGKRHDHSPHGDGASIQPRNQNVVPAERPLSPPKDKISNLQNLNRRLMEQIKDLREERDSLVKKNESLSLRVESFESQIREWEETKSNMMLEVKKLSASLQEREALSTKIQEEAETERNLMEAKLGLSQKEIEELRIEGELKLGKSITEYENKLKQRDSDYKVVLEKANRNMLQAQEQLKRTICEKDEELMRKSLETEELQSRVNELEHQSQRSSGKAEADAEKWKAERERLLSEVLSSKKEIEELVELEKAWGLEREQLCQKIDALGNDKLDLQSNLNEWKGMSDSLLTKLSEEQTLWQNEKKAMEDDFEEAKFRLDVMTNEHESLKIQNSEVLAEVQHLMAQLSEYKKALSKAEMQRQELEASSNQHAKTLDTENKALRADIALLRQQLEEETEQHASIVERCNVTESHLKQTCSMLEKELFDAQNALKSQNIKIEELGDENEKTRQRAEWSARKIEELQDRVVNLCSAKEDGERAFHAKEAESAEKYDTLGRQYETALDEINFTRGALRSLQKEKADIEMEKDALVCVLDDTSKKSAELSNEIAAEKQRIASLEITVENLQQEKLSTEIEKGVLKQFLAENNEKASALESRLIDLENEAVESESLLKKMHGVVEDMYILFKDSCPGLEEMHEADSFEKKAGISALKLMPSYIKKVRQLVDNKAEEVCKLQGLLEALRDEKAKHVSQLEYELSSLQKKQENDSADMKHQFSILVAEKELADEEMRSLKNELHKQVPLVNEERAHRERMIKETDVVLDGLRQDLSSTKAALQKNKVELTNLQDSLSELSQIRKELENRNDCLQKDLENNKRVLQENVNLHEEEVKKLENIIASNFEKQNNQKGKPKAMSWHAAIASTGALAAAVLGAYLKYSK